MALVLRKADLLPPPRLSVRSPVWVPFGQGALMLLTSQLLIALVPVVDALFAARLQQGDVATLGYASRLILGLQGLAGLALQRSALPILAELTKHSPDIAARVAWRWAFVAATVGAGLGLSIAALAEPLISLLFERGRFTAHETEQVATLLRWGMIQMPFFLGGLAVVTALASAGARHVLAISAFVAVVVKLLATMWLVPAYGVLGLPVGTAVMFAATAMVVSWGLIRLRSAAK
jgi:peptidoglycan biosynthesis protein MviN/MurJ (putative lipid II flippase)